MKIKRFHSPYQRLVALWILRALTPGSSMLRTASLVYEDEDVATALGFPSPTTREVLEKIPDALARLRAYLESARTRLPIQAQRNFDQLCETLLLSQVERRVLEFYAVMSVASPLRDAWRIMWVRVTQSDPKRDLHRILGLEKRQVARSLESTGRLVRCGLLRQESHGSKETLGFCSEQLAWHLIHERYVPSKILKTFGIASPKTPNLDLTDYPHLQRDLAVLLPYLRNVTAMRKSGVNILLHGAPGTGKTQLARVLGKELAVPVLELNTADRDGAPLAPTDRLPAINLAQSYFKDIPVILVFDEAEDVLTPSPVDRGVARSHKGWFNHLLESNPQPVIWISNSIRSLDPAFARRFDYLLEVPVPPQSQRKRVIAKIAGGLLSPSLVRHLSEQDTLAPAVITRTRDVLITAGDAITRGDRDAAFVRIAGNILRAQGHPDPFQSPPQILTENVYDIAYLNTTADLAGIAARLRQHPEARICLHGPPGTGKSAFGRWLAREIDRPLRIERASDLLNAFVGGTEQQIAGAFEQAMRDEAVLMIDEIDSFLQDRSRAQRSWEVTQVNEMLTRMESFRGVLIASTNRLEHLDAASLRRFDLNLHFGYLQPAQTRNLLAAWCRKLAIPPPDDDDLRMVGNLENAAAGDFAAAARRHRFQPFADAAALVRAVSESCEIKIERSRTIGFRAS